MTHLPAADTRCLLRQPLIRKRTWPARSVRRFEYRFVHDSADQCWGWRVRREGV